MYQHSKSSGINGIEFVGIHTVAFTSHLIYMTSKIVKMKNGTFMQCKDVWGLHCNSLYYCRSFRLFGSCF